MEILTQLKTATSPGINTKGSTVFCSMNRCSMFVYWISSGERPDGRDKTSACNRQKPIAEWF